MATAEEVAAAVRDKERAAEVGRRLRLIRQQRNMSRAEVEEKSGGVWTQYAVGSWERADRQPRIGTLLDLVAWYGADIGEVLPTGLPASVVSRETAMGLPHGEVRTVMVQGGQNIYLRMRAC
jgi:transcriptional regulator with XRE-family HTH domain